VFAIRLLVCVALVTGAEPGAAPPGPSPTCTIIGRVTAARGAPVALAEIVVLGTRVGAVTDEAGAFVLAGLPPGAFQIRIRGPGILVHMEALRLTPGDTLRREFNVGPNRYDELHDSLSALGEWPPRIAPDVLDNMRHVSKVRVFRLDPDHVGSWVSPDSEHRFGPWPIVGEADPPSRGLVRTLIEALAASSVRLRVAGEPQKMCGGFSPGIDVRFIGEDQPVDVLLCYACGEFSLSCGGEFRQSGYFASPGFVEFAVRAFPRDSVLSRLRTRSGGD